MRFIVWMAPVHRSRFTREKVSDFSGVRRSMRKSFLIWRECQKIDAPDA
jgi:hypothetical protein